MGGSKGAEVSKSWGGTFWTAYALGRVALYILNCDLILSYLIHLSPLLPPCSGPQDFLRTRTAQCIQIDF